MAQSAPAQSHLQPVVVDDVRALNILSLTPAIHRPLKASSPAPRLEVVLDAFIPRCHLGPKRWMG